MTMSGREERNRCCASWQLSASSISYPCCSRKSRIPNLTPDSSSTTNTLFLDIKNLPRMVSGTSLSYRLHLRDYCRQLIVLRVPALCVARLLNRGQCRHAVSRKTVRKFLTDPPRVFRRRNPGLRTGPTPHFRR